MDNETLASLLRGRNRAGQPVDATANIIGPAMSALGNTIYGAGRGALTAMAGLPGDINQLITDNIGTLVNAQGLPTTKDIQDFLPLKPTTYEGKLAQKLGEFVPVNPTPIAKGAVTIAKPVGKAMGEQAYRMTEDMLQKQGMMPSIVAYHGTPHNIEGAFDISKVGTGEGAQAYGHGMYYAENPKVADQYRKDLSADINYDYDTKKYQVIDKRKKILGEFDDLRTANEEAIKAGNLYKVDIPDEYVPKMLDWDKPLSEQSQEIKDALSNIPHRGKDWTFKTTIETLDAAPYLREDVTLNPTGSEIYSLLGDAMMVGNKAPGQINASKKLNELGIKGIRYLDESSRDKKQGTSNFVVFDPKEVKILEKNSKPVSRKEMLEQAFEGSMPHYKDYENLASVFEKAGLKIKETGSSKSGSKYVEINDPVSGEILTVRFADHPQTGSAISLHGNADIEIGEPFKNKSWKDAINPILDRINKSRKQYGDELLTINQK